VVLAASTLPWPPVDATARRRARAGVAGYVVLCSGLVWVFANGSAGPLGFVGANAYVWVSIGLLALLPIGRAGTEDHPGLTEHCGAVGAQRGVATDRQR